MIGKLRAVAAGALLSGLMMTPALATVLQCVPYARAVSGVEIRGDALTWWQQADGLYRRGHTPRKGAVLAFKPYGPMVLGHVAVVSKVLDDRHVLIRHANWSVPGAIEEDVLALDVSDEGDWSAVRVWHSPTAQMGARVNPTFGFIYPAKARLHDFTPDAALGDYVRLAKAGDDAWKSAPAILRDDVRVTMEKTARSKRKSQPRLEADPSVVNFADAAPTQRSLSAIIADVKRESAMN
ncbi:MAG: CHAP domain-containing protein [Sphingobium sp.]|uniref:CHAP domain-containing protein n=1 Tax=Sphingobium sp. TaxID=1912891 RepID=UPI000DB51F03|nr:CHAP domain-containing protein [Sphingobium sp.]PZU12957.1 MAG: CHAP domain-containing protein [Sphingobium sp.]